VLITAPVPFEIGENEIGGGDDRTPLPFSERGTIEATDAEREALSSQALRERLEDFARCTRLLALSCDLYLLLLAAVAPASVLLLHEEPALRLVGPLVLLVHGLGFWGLVRAVRRTSGGRPRDHLELLVAAAIFPPSMLRARHDLLRVVTARFHPAAAAAVLLERSALLDYLRCELAALDARARRSGLRRGPSLYREGLERLAAERKISPAELSAPRARPDADASSYCPLCVSDYRPGFDVCADCGAATVRYGDFSCELRFAP
jgi:hypothetical protein